MSKETKLAKAMSEVHKNIPSNVEKTGKTGKVKERMLQAIAFSKAGMSKKWRGSDTGKTKA